MDPLLRELYESGPEDEEVRVILRLEKGAEPPPRVQIVSRFGEVATARIIRKDIPSTWENDAVASLKAPRPVTPPLPSRNLPDESDDLLEDEAQDGPGNDGWDQPTNGSAAASLVGVPEDGHGVVVGICDWGFDFTHPNFRNADGTTRLEALWDQRGSNDLLSPSPYNHGRLLTREAVNQALVQPDPCRALGYYPASADAANMGTHGTHVSDIVAGNRREPGSVVGLASGAHLNFVHLGAQRVGELGNLGDSVGLLEGLDFVRRQAAGRPCVMHLSAGKTGGPKIGSTLVERAVDHMLLETPGLVLIQSVGNYASTAMHTHARVGPDQRHTLRWIIPDNDRTPNELEIWYSGRDVFDVRLISPDGQEFSVPLDDRKRLTVGGEVWGNFYHRLQEPNSGLNHVVVFLYAAAPGGGWQVILHGRDVVDGRLHAWIERDAGSRYQSRFDRAQATSLYTTNTICNSFRAIAVGAYDATRPNRPPARFSSRGPTGDGRQKPELAAPGCKILAARSLPRDGWAPGQSRLCVKSGTSMAAPWVSGTVALMFQAARRPLSIHEVRRILIGTADPHSGPSGRSSSQLGYGYLNTAAAVAAARRLGAEQPASSGLAPLAGEEIESEDANGWPPIWIEDAGADEQGDEKTDDSGGADGRAWLDRGAGAAGHDETALRSADETAPDAGESTLDLSSVAFRSTADEETERDCGCGGGGGRAASGTARRAWGQDRAVGGGEMIQSGFAAGELREALDRVDGLDR